MTFDINDDNTVSLRVEVPDKKNEEGMPVYQPSKRFTAPNFDAAMSKASEIYIGGVEDEPEKKPNDGLEAKKDDDTYEKEKDTFREDGLKKEKKHKNTEGYKATKTEY